MPCALPAGIAPGQIYRHAQYYRNTEGQWKSKYLLVLAGSPSGDVIYRLLTSRVHGRPKTPRCFHGLPYPGFYLGLLGGPLTSDSWLSLHESDDYDGAAFGAALRSGLLQSICTLAIPLLCSVLACVANADDTTRQQERCIRDVRAALACS
jgi:hypothetical protein